MGSTMLAAAAAFLAAAARLPGAAGQPMLTFDLVQFDNATRAATGASCLDGSPAGYYLNTASPPSTTWVLFLQGGGACLSASGPASCWLRYNTSLGSSTYWPAPTAQMGGNFFWRDCAANPAFCAANYVYVPYCTGDVHGGQRRGPVSPAMPFTFAGHNNIVAVLASLLATTDVGAATDVLVAGSSAGGLGTFLNADFVAATLPSTVRVRANPQAGYFFPPVTPFASWAAGNTAPPYAGQSAALLALWQPFGNAACAAVNNATYCAPVYASYPYIKTPMFLIENQADSNQVRPCTARLRSPLAHVAQQPTHPPSPRCSSLWSWARRSTTRRRCSRTCSTTRTPWWRRW